MPTDLRLRRADPADLPEIAELFWATRTAAVPEMPMVVEAPDEARAFICGWDVSRPRPREVWVAEDDLGLAGYAVLKDDWLDSLYVAPDRQGEGVGGALLDLVKGICPDGFMLWVFLSNSPARGFYRRHGLVELEQTDGSANTERSPDVRMAWPGHDPLAFLRTHIDLVDAELAELLARRFALAAAVQGVKDTPGHRGRETRREREIAERMVRHAPGLTNGRVARIMHAVIGEGLSAWEDDDS